MQTKKAVKNRTRQDSVPTITLDNLETLLNTLESRLDTVEGTVATIGNLFQDVDLIAGNMRIIAKTSLTPNFWLIIHMICLNPLSPWPWFYQRVMMAITQPSTFTAMP